MKRYFYIEGKFYGEAQVKPFISIQSGAMWATSSELFFCSQCGDVFARCPVILPSGECMPWQPVYALCSNPACSAVPNLPGKLVAGSIWHWNPSFHLNLPEAVLLREASLHLKKLESL